LAQRVPVDGEVKRMVRLEPPANLDGEPHLSSRPRESPLSAACNPGSTPRRLGTSASALGTSTTT
jgi:hypothetical protein